MQLHDPKTEASGLCKSVSDCAQPFYCNARELQRKRGLIMSRTVMEGGQVV